MSEKQPYNLNDDWNELPLPAEDASWQKMKELLDKEEKKRRVIPPFFLNCAGIALLASLLTAGLWQAFKPDGFLNRKESAVASGPAVKHHVPASSIPKTKSEKTTTVPGQGQTNNPSLQHIIPSSQSFPKDETTVATENLNDRIAKEKSPPKEHGNFFAGKTRSGKISTSKHGAEKSGEEKETELVTKTDMRFNSTTNSANTNSGKPDSTSSFMGRTDRLTDNGDLISADTIGVISNNVPVQRNADTTEANKIISENLASPVEVAATVDKRFKKNKPSRFHFSAGLGIHQQLKSGNRFSYNADSIGKTRFFTEHIPSVYFKVHHKQNWFVMGEFRFGAPQLVKDYSFSRQTKYDSSSTSLVVTSQRLRKLYYHQLPLSFNYNLLPQLSIGVGGVYSIFYRAVTEQEINKKNIFTGAEFNTIRTERIPRFTDSFLYKTQVHAIIQADYQWKNFSLGIRYKRDLQPYIKYTTPDGIVTDEKNDAVEAILRYRIWRSKKR